MLTTDTANTAYKKRKTWTSLRLHHHCCFSHNFPLFASLEALVCPGIQKCVAAHHTSRVKARELLENSQSFCFNSPNAVPFQQAWHVLEDQPNVTTAFLVRGNLYTTTTAQSKTTAKLFWFSNLHVRHRRTPLSWLYSFNRIYNYESQDYFWYEPPSDFRNAKQSQALSMEHMLQLISPEILMATITVILQLRKRNLRILHCFPRYCSHLTASF